MAQTEKGSHCSGRAHGTDPNRTPSGSVRRGGQTGLRGGLAVSFLFWLLVERVRAAELCPKYQYRAPDGECLDLLICTGSQYVARSPAFDPAGVEFVSDRVCDALSTECAVGELERTSQAVVVEGPNGPVLQFDEDTCGELTRCADTHFEHTQPEPGSGGVFVSDRICKPLRTCCTAHASAVECTDDTIEYEHAAPNQDGEGRYVSDRICKPVSASCTGSQLELAAPTPTSDRECVDCVASCPSGTYHPTQLEAPGGAAFGAVCADGTSFANLVCLSCPAREVDVVFLLDNGSSMKSKIKEAQNFMEGIVSHMAFSTEPEAQALGRVAVVSYNDADVATRHVEFANRSASNQSEVLNAIRAIVPSPETGTRMGRLDRQLRAVISEVVSVP